MVIKIRSFNSAYDHFHLIDVLFNWYPIDFLIISGACSSHYNDSTINEQTIHQFEYQQLNSIKSKSNNFHDRCNNQENSSHLCTSLLVNGPSNVGSNSIITLNLDSPQHLESLKSSLVYDNIESNDSQPKDGKASSSSLTYDFLLKKSINDKKSCRNYIKSCVKTMFKSLTRSLEMKVNDNASKAIKSSSEAQSWADIRVLPKLQQNL